MSKFKDTPHFFKIFFYKDLCVGKDLTEFVKIPMFESLIFLFKFFYFYKNRYFKNFDRPDLAENPN
jgi:hypothetical protein